jgi:hypothetical protein
LLGLLRRQKISPPITSNKTAKPISTAPAIVVPLTLDLLLAAAVAAVDELVPVGVVVEVNAEVEIVEVKVGFADAGRNVTPVYTICNLRSAGWPLNVVWTVVASDVAPQAHCK